LDFYIRDFLGGGKCSWRRFAWVSYSPTFKYKTKVVVADTDNLCSILLFGIN
jgi:hypothetical protein